MAYYLAPSLVQLRNEIDQRWPKRDKRSDGWIGDTSHSARVSDHNPDYGSGGVVRAIDVDITSIDREACLKEIIGDDRVWYVISNGIIYSRTYGWKARRYTGSNGHYQHFHVSIRHSSVAERDTSPWFGSSRPRTTKLPWVSLASVRKAARKGGDRELPGVKRIQRALNRINDAGLAVDGHFGARTKRAYLAYERKTNTPQGHRKGSVDGIPNLGSLRRLGRGRFTVKPAKNERKKKG